MTTKKLVGTHVEREDAAYLSLYSMAEGVSKSFIVREKISQWLARQRDNQSIDDLITKIADQAQREWDTTHRKYKYTDRYYIDDSPFDYFKRMVSLRLKAKGVEPRHINRILERLHDETTKTERTP